MCKRHKSTINPHDINRAIEVARRTSRAFTNRIPYCDLWAWLDGLDCLQHLQANDGSCMECFLLYHLPTSVGLHLLVSAVHTGDTEMVKTLLRVYDDMDNCAEHAMHWAQSVTSSPVHEKT